MSASSGRSVESRAGACEDRPPGDAISVPAALTLLRAGRHREAREACVALLEVPMSAEDLDLLAEICTALGEPSLAVRALQRLSRAAGRDAALCRRLGAAWLSLGSVDEAIGVLRDAVALEPANARGQNNLGQALLRAGQRAEAMRCYAQALAVDPTYAPAHNNLGVMHAQAGQYGEARDCYQRAILCDPSFAEAYLNCGNASLQLGEPTQALACFDRVMTLRPRWLEGQLGRANALQTLGRADEAIGAYERALELSPGHVQTLCNYASLLLSLRRPEQALALCEQAIRRDPDLPEAHSNRAGALRLLNRLDEARAACELSLRLEPARADGWSNLANVCLAMGRTAEAIDCCDRSLELQPSHARALEQRGLALLADKQPARAAQDLDRLRRMHPHHKYALGFALNARLHGCDWGDLAAMLPEVRERVRGGEAVITPFCLLSVLEDPELHWRCARIFAEDQLRPAASESFTRERPHERTRVAYLSADFGQHATAALTAGLFEAHDRSGFEIYGVSFGADDGSEMRKRLEQGFDHFIDVSARSDAEVAALLRSLEIDIAVDLKGYTSESRPGILARRAAPVQVSYLGYPGTLALDQVDYILADPIVLPGTQQAYYSEHIVHLPGCYQVNDALRALPRPGLRRSDVGLPPDAFVFCCFNNNYKILPAMFDLWMRLLRELPRSVLWLLEDNPAAAGHLRAEAFRRGIDSDRLVFAPRVTADIHMARHLLADLFLDTLPYNAHTTCSDALWAALPVLTLAGAAFPGRVAASLLTAVGLADLITHSPEQYCARALELAESPRRLAEIRRRLEQTRGGNPLFDTRRFCRGLEAAYRTMLDRQHL